MQCDVCVCVCVCVCMCVCVLYAACLWQLCQGMPVCTCTRHDGLPPAFMTTGSSIKHSGAMMRAG